MTAVHLFRLAWGLWLLSWLLATPWSAPTLKRAVTGATTLNRIVIIAGAVLLLGGVSWLDVEHLWHVGRNGMWLLAALTVAAFLFAWWARLHLGRLWSGAITRKEGHRLIETGPYAVVRHPIYTGLIAAALVTAVAEETLQALLGAALITLGLWGKAALEERFLRQEFGPVFYDAYRRRVPMLIPFLPRVG